MRFDIRGRQAGKTHDMIEWMRAAPEGVVRAYVGHTKEAATVALRLADSDPDNRLETWQFIGIEEARRPFHLMADYRSVEFGIDNADLILQRMVPMYPLTYVTATGEYAYDD